MFIRSRLRPMIRVETLVLAVIAWLVATANFAWWSAVGQGRQWSQPVELVVHRLLLHDTGGTALRRCSRPSPTAGWCGLC